MRCTTQFSSTQLRNRYRNLLQILQLSQIRKRTDSYFGNTLCKVRIVLVKFFQLLMQEIARFLFHLVVQRI